MQHKSTVNDGFRKQIPATNLDKHLGSQQSTSS